MRREIRRIGSKHCTIFEEGSGGPTIYWGAGAGRELEKTAGLLAAKTKGRSWRLAAFEADDWNADFSPWPSPAVFGREDFSGRAQDTLDWLVRVCLPAVEEEQRPRFLAGYSLAGLFSLWAFYESGLFQGAASCSGSLWYPGWMEYARGRKAPQRSTVYLSLGEREERTRNRALSRVGETTRAMDALLDQDENIASHALCWHPGGHFDDVEERMAQGMAWLVATQPSSFRGDVKEGSCG